MKVARARGIVTVAMTGATRGAVADLADHWIAIPHTETQKIQEGHLVLGHINLRTDGTPDPRSREQSVA